MVKHKLTGIFIGVICLLLFSAVVSAQTPPDLRAKIKCPKSAFAGQDLGKKIKVKLINSGAGGAEEVGVDILLSSDKVIPLQLAGYQANWKEDVLLLGGREFVNYIKGKTSVNVKMNGNNRIPADTPPGQYYIGVFVDSKDVNRESNERNNTDLCSIRIHNKAIGEIEEIKPTEIKPSEIKPVLRKKPDLKAKKAFVKPDPVKEGEKANLHCEFKNRVADLKGTWYISYRVDGKEVYSQKWGDLKKGELRNPAGWWTAAGVGWHSYSCVLDSTKAINEKNEQNNVASTRFRVIEGDEVPQTGLPGEDPTGADTQQGKPNLVPRIVCRSLRTVKAGDELKDTFQVIMKNAGTADAANIGVDIVLSSDIHIPLKTAVVSVNWKEDALLVGGREFESGLAAGAVVNVKLNGSNTIPADTPSGKYYLGVFVDSTFKNDETNERDNVALCPIRVVGKPKLQRIVQ